MVHVRLGRSAALAALTGLGLVTTGCAAGPATTAATGHGVAAAATPAAGASASGAGASAPAPGPTGSGPTENSPTGNSPTGSGQDQAAGLSLPIERYLIGSAENNRIQTSQTALIGACLKRFGFDYTPAPDLDPRSQMTNRYGPTDPEVARTRGYHAAPATAAGAGPATARPTVPPAMAAVLGQGVGAPLPAGSTASPTPGTYNGITVPAGGCVGEAQQRLTAGGGILQDDQAAVDINFQDYQRSLADPRTKAAFTRWSQCMNGEGYRYDSPENAVNDSRWRTATPSALELATASADVACKQRADVVTTWFGVESDLENQDIQAELQRLAKVRQGIDTAVRNAGSALPATP